MRIVVLGLGNVLVGDDAFGPHVLRHLEARYDLPAEVELLEGTPGLDLVPHLLGAEALVVVDTVRAAGLPGEIRLYRSEAIMRQPPQSRVSPHDPGLKETLFTLQLHDAAPASVLLVGTVPGDVSTGTRLSDAVRAAIDPAVRAVVEELERLGVVARERSEPGTAATWWDRQPAER